jgi:hypothetical protein
MLGRNVDVANWQRDPRITGGQGMEMERGMNGARDSHYEKSTGRGEKVISMQVNCKASQGELKWTILGTIAMK